MVHAERTQLNLDKFKVVLIAGGVLYALAGVYLLIADSMKVLGITLDRRLTFDNHVSAVAQSCSYHSRSIRHIVIYYYRT